MNEVINRLINIDNAAKQIVKKEQVRLENVDDLVLDKLNQKKLQIDLDYDVRLKIKKEKLDKKLSESNEILEYKSNEFIKNLEDEYEKNKKKIIKEITTKILDS